MHNLSANEKEIIAFYLDKIIQTMHPQKVYLYGSKAKGTADAFSDTDFAVITDGVFDTTEIYGAADIIDFTKAPESLKQEILKSGIVLYERKE